MSTRAVYTFKDQNGAFHVYKHHDGYPSGAVEAIENAIPLSWELPRYEAEEFAAAFVAGNKAGGGDVYFSEGPEAHGDLDYRYEITAEGKNYLVRAIEIQATNGDETEVFKGTLKDATEWANKPEETDGEV